MNSSRNYKNIHMKSISKLSLLIAFFTVQVMVAQQDPNFTLYNFNMNVINPAYAGANNSKELSLSHRSQWLGIPNAPSTQSVVYTSPLGKNLGIGVSVINDEVFVLQETDVAVDISYKLQLNETHQLYFGLKAGGGFVNIDLSKAGALANDPLFTQNQSFFNPHLGAGLYLKHKKYYVSISTPNFLNGKRYEKRGNTPRAAIQNMHAYLGAGYSFTITDNFELTPAFMLRHVNGAPNSYDISSSLKMYEKFIVGGNYRIDEMASIYSVIQVINKLNIGFAYDFTVSKVNQIHNNGSIEFMLKYQF